MMNSFKKTKVALILAAALTLPLTMTAVGCGYNSRFIMSVDGEDKASGIYIMNQFGAYKEAQKLFSEAYPDANISEDGFDYNAYKIEDKNFNNWINDRAIELTSISFIIEKMFDEQSLSFTDEEKAEIESAVNTSWLNDRWAEELYAIYGEEAPPGGSGETWEDFFTKAGVSKESFKFYHTNTVKRTRVFESIYDEGGANPVPDDEWKAVFENGYVRYRALPISTVGEDGKTLPETELEALREFEKTLIEDITNGGSLTQARLDYEAFKKSDDGETNDDKDSETEDEEDHTGHNHDENGNEIEDESSEEKEEWEDFDVYEELDRKSFEEIMKISDYADTEIMKFILDLEIKVPKIYELETSDYILMRMDIMGNDEVLNENRTLAIAELKEDEFNNDLKARVETAKADNTIIINEKATNKYSPDIFYGMGVER